MCFKNNKLKKIGSMNPVIIQDYIIEKNNKTKICSDNIEKTVAGCKPFIPISFFFYITYIFT